MAAKVTVEQMLEAGVHFGHQVKRWNPKMKHFVFGVKNGIHIIDLTKTMRQLAIACEFLYGKVGSGADILFVGTKRQAQETVREAAEKTQMCYVTERWLGGLLTNNTTIRKSVKTMKDIEKSLESDAVKMNKKEAASLRRQADKLHKNLDGIAKMTKLPGVIVLVDTCKEDIAVKEANKLGIPIVALVDTNGDPDLVNYPIPCNDDALKSIKTIMGVLAEVIALAAETYRKQKAEDDAERAAKEATAAANKAKDDADKPARKPAPRSGGAAGGDRRGGGGGGGPRAGGPRKDGPRDDAAKSGDAKPKRKPVAAKDAKPTDVKPVAAVPAFESAPAAVAESAPAVADAAPAA